MPVIKPYDPTNVANRVVGVANYSKAKAGEAAETIATGLGKIRSEVASNASQNINSGFSIADHLVNGVGNALANALDSYKASQQKFNAMAAASDADDIVDEFNRGVDARTTDVAKNYAEQPELAKDAFTNSIEAPMQDPAGNFIHVSKDGNSLDRQTTLDRIKNVPNITPEAYYAAKRAIGDKVTRATQLVEHTASEQQNAKIHAIPQAVTNGLADNLISLKGNVEENTVAARPMIQTAIQRLEKLRPQLGNEFVDKSLETLQKKALDALIVGNTRRIALIDDPVQALQQAKAAHDQLDVVSGQSFLGMGADPDQTKRLHGYINNAETMQVEALEDKINSAEITDDNAFSNTKFKLEQNFRDPITLNNTQLFIQQQFTKNQAAIQNIRGNNALPIGIRNQILKSYETRNDRLSSLQATVNSSRETIQARTDAERRHQEAIARADAREAASTAKHIQMENEKFRKQQEHEYELEQSQARKEAQAAVITDLSNQAQEISTINRASVAGKKQLMQAVINYIGTAAQARDDKKISPQMADVFIRRGHRIVSAAATSKQLDGIAGFFNPDGVTQMNATDNITEIGKQVSAANRELDDGVAAMLQGHITANYMQKTSGLTPAQAQDFADKQNKLRSTTQYKNAPPATRQLWDNNLEAAYKASLQPKPTAFSPQPPAVEK